RLALTVMRDFPAGVRSAVLDSPVPLQANYADIPGNYASAFDSFFASCEADTTCNHAYPNLRQIFNDAVDRLNKQPVQFTLGPDRQVAITGDSLIAALGGALSIGEMVPQLPKAIYTAHKGDVTPLVPFATSGPYITFGLYESVTCSEQILPAGQ